MFLLGEQNDPSGSTGFTYRRTEGFHLGEQMVSIWENRGFSLGEQAFPSGGTGDSLRKTGISLWENRGFSLGEQRVPSGRKEVSI